MNAWEFHKYSICYFYYYFEFIAPYSCWFFLFPPVITGNCSPDYDDMMQFSNPFHGPAGKYSHMITTMCHLWSFMSQNELMMPLYVAVLKFMKQKEKNSLSDRLWLKYHLSVHFCFVLHRDGSIPVSLIRKYLKRKLDLISEDEVSNPIPSN